jgi:predicted nucleic acid-binding protein
MIVIDCSIMIAAVLEDEESTIADGVFRKLMNSQRLAIVPAIFYTETINVLLTALRKRRIDRKTWQNYHETIAVLPLEIDEAVLDPEKMIEISLIAEEYHLSAYDAAYLELAKRQKATLVTLDKKLHRAAVLSKVAYSH